MELNYHITLENIERACRQIMEHQKPTFKVEQIEGTEMCNLWYKDHKIICNKGFLLDLANAIRKELDITYGTLENS